MSAVMTDEELDYLHATTFGDGHLRLIREHKALRAKSTAAERMYEALERFILYEEAMDDNDDVTAMLRYADFSRMARAALKAAGGGEQ